MLSFNSNLEILDKDSAENLKTQLFIEITEIST